MAGVRPTDKHQCNYYHFAFYRSQLTSHHFVLTSIGVVAPNRAAEYDDSKRREEKSEEKVKQ